MIECVASAPDVFHAVPAQVIEHVAPAPAAICTAPAPAIEDVTSAPVVTCATPVPVSEHVAPSPMIEYIALAPSVTISTPSLLLPPAHTMAAVTTGVSLDTVSVVFEPPRKKQCSETKFRRSLLSLTPVHEP